MARHQEEQRMNQADPIHGRRRARYRWLTMAPAILIAVTGCGGSTATTTPVAATPPPATQPPATAVPATVAVPTAVPPTAEVSTPPSVGPTAEVSTPPSVGPTAEVSTPPSVEPTAGETTATETTGASASPVGALVPTIDLSTVGGAGEGKLDIIAWIGYAE